MQQAIQEALQRIETTDDVRVLFAVESGSRAWGFASRDSDWDVRFVYIRRPGWYLSVQRRRDVLEYPLDSDLDVSGWDVKKALGLFAKSNPPLLEWLRSPIVYREAFSLAQTLRTLSAQYFSSRSVLHHYFHMAEGNYREYLQGDPVRVKKYFYVLGPSSPADGSRRTARCRPWSSPPWSMTNSLPTCGRSSMRCWSASARVTSSASGPRIPVINEFLDSEMTRLRDALGAIPPSPPPDWEALDRVFRESLVEVWGGSFEPTNRGET